MIYADDTVLYIDHGDISTIEDLLEEDINKITFQHG